MAYFSVADKYYLFQLCSKNKTIDRGYINTSLSSPPMINAHERLQKLINDRGYINMSLSSPPMINAYERLQKLINDEFRIGMYSEKQKFASGKQRCRMH